MSWRSVVTVLLLLGALLSGWSVWKQQRQERGPTGPAARSDYVLENFELIVLDKQGRESFTVRAPRLARDPVEKTLDIPTPLFLIPPGEAGGDTWEVRAGSGWVSANAEELRLRDDVLASRVGGTGAPTTVRTERLNVYPETRRASSPDRVVITRPGSILSGRGLQLDMANKKYSFASEVRHRYAPPAR